MARVVASATALDAGDDHGNPEESSRHAEAGPGRCNALGVAGRGKGDARGGVAEIAAARPVGTDRRRVQSAEGPVGDANTVEGSGEDVLLARSSAGWWKGAAMTCLRRPRRLKKKRARSGARRGLEQRGRGRARATRVPLGPRRRVARRRFLRRRRGVRRCGGPSAGSSLPPARRRRFLIAFSQGHLWNNGVLLRRRRRRSAEKALRYARARGSGGVGWG